MTWAQFFLGSAEISTAVFRGYIEDYILKIFGFFLGLRSLGSRPGIDLTFVDPQISPNT